MNVKESSMQPAISETGIAKALVASGWGQIRLEYWPGDEEHAPAWKCFGVWDDGWSPIRIWARGQTPLEAMMQFSIKATAVKGEAAR